MNVHQYSLVVMMMLRRLKHFMQKKKEKKRNECVNLFCIFHCDSAEDVSFSFFFSLLKVLDSELGWLYVE